MRADRRRPRPRRTWLWLLSAGAAVIVLVVLLVVVLVPRGTPPLSAPVVEAPTLSPASGRIYAVSPEGDDGGPGTSTRPWRTFSHAFAELRAGDRLVVGGGRYEENVDVTVRKGTQQRPIQVVPAEGARPVVVGLLWLQDLSWWDIRGLNVTWSDSNDADQHMVKLTDGANWRFADAELWGARSFAALLVDGAPKNFTLSGLYVHDTHPSNDTNQDHLVYLNCGSGGGVLERSILAHSENGRAIKIGPPSNGDGKVGRITIRYVTMVDNRGPSNVQLAYDVSGVTIEHSILVGSAEGRASVTSFDLDGRDNVVSDSLSWDSTGMLDGDEHIADGGGNVRLDPRLTGAGGDQPYRPREPAAQNYGRWAPGA